MNTKIKHRVIGALVLLALLAIFVPVLFHSKKSANNLKLSLNIPKKPDAPQVQFTTLRQDNVQSVHAAVNLTKMASEDAESLALQQQTKTIKHLAKKSAKPTKPAAPVLAKKAKPKEAPVFASATEKAAGHAHAESVASVADAKSGMPQAWAVQVGTFSRASNAKHLANRLRKRGYDVYTRSSESDKRTLVRVFVGPQIRKNRAVDLQVKLARQFRLSGVVRKYTL